MKRLSVTKRAAVLRCLIEGNSGMSTARITGVSRNAIAKILVETGDACSCYMHKHMVDLPCTELQMDELWSFVLCKEKNKAPHASTHTGDVWTWTAICPHTKIIPSWRVGDRSHTTSYAFCNDLATRFTGSLQITTDGLSAYRWAVGNNFTGCTLTQLVKTFGKNAEGEEICTGTVKTPMIGSPDLDRASTSLVERSNLTLRMTNRRMTRLTNAFSKHIEQHCHMLAITIFAYNFLRVHRSIKSTPAQAAGVADKQWNVEDLAQMVEQFVEEQAMREFEAEFARMKFSPRGTVPKSFEPQTPRTPWYLDPESGGPDPVVRKPGIAYRTDLS